VVSEGDFGMFLATKPVQNLVFSHKFYMSTVFTLNHTADCCQFNIYFWQLIWQVNGSSIFQIPEIKTTNL